MAPRKQKTSLVRQVQYPVNKNKSVTVGKFFETGWKDYVIYTISNRAIPSVIDGLKPSQRKAVFCARQQRKMIKVSGLTGATMTDGNYHHGDASMNDTIIGLAAPYSNNIPLLDKEGVFGSRLVKDAGAPRYISVKISNNFDKYFFDNHILTPQPDPEDPEPLFYLPIIPWVLVNGVEGIATAYSTDIPRFNPKDIAALCYGYINGKSIDSYEILPYYEGFQGTFQKSGKGFLCSGRVNVIDSNTFEITEIPLHFDHLKYVAVLDNLKQKDIIASYTDDSRDGVFKFVVKLRKTNGPSIGRGSTMSDKDIIKNFKLESKIPMNLNVLDEKNNLMTFNSPIDIIKYFCDYRIKTIQTRITTNIKLVNDKIDLYNERLKFIQLVLDSKITFKNNTRVQLIEQMVKHKLNQDYFDSHLEVKIYNLTTDSIQKTKDAIADLTTQLNYWNTTTPVKEFSKDLKSVI